MARISRAEPHHSPSASGTPTRPKNHAKKTREAGQSQVARQAPYSASVNREASDHGATNSQESKSELEDLNGNGNASKDRQDESDTEEEVEDDTERTPKSAKRARVSRDGSMASIREQDYRRKKANPSMLPRDIDGFIPGSIVRVKLHQFLTYDDVEFKPGPYLNMVLGPNGTGKSSIACALCLGLNWPPSILGRATNLGSFIKQGYNEAYIEIELKGPKSRPNLIIHRDINKTLVSNNEGTVRKEKVSTSFTINGEQTTGRHISEQVEGLGIQVNNLCSFLPQDKVAEFAQMNPQELLRATQKAAGNEHLIKWHDALIEIGKALKKLSEEVNEERNQLNSLEQRNAAQEKEVQAYKQRRNIEREIEFLELVLPFKEYADSKIEYDKLKKLRAELHKRTVDLQDKNQPIRVFAAELAERHKACEKERDKHKNASKTAFKAARDEWQDNEHLEQQSETVQGELINLRNRDRARREKIMTYKRDIQRTEHELANPPEIEDMSIIEADIRTNHEHLQRAARTKQSFQDEIREFAEKSAEHTVNIDRATNELRRLDDVSVRKLEMLAKWDRDTADAVRWIRENKHLFKMEVLEPPVLSMTVKEQRYTAAIEGCINGIQLRNFVAQCLEDYKLFFRVFTDTTEALGRKASVHCWFRPRKPEALLAPPMSDRELHDIGFDKYAIDCVDCPDGLRWYLQMECSFHRTAIGLDSRRIDTRRAMEAVAQPGPDGRGGGASFVAGSTYNQVTRSRYGRRMPQNSTRELRPARNLAFPPVDQARIEEIRRRIHDAQSLKNEAEEEVRRIETKIRDIEADINTLQGRREGIERRKSAVLQAKTMIQKLEIRLNTLKEKLANEENAPPIDEERRDLQAKLFSIAKKRAKILTRYRDIYKKIMQLNEAATKAGLEWLQIGANASVLEQMNVEANNQLAQARHEFNIVDDEYQDVKATTKEKLAISRNKLESIDDELRARFDEENRAREDGQDEGHFMQRDVDDIRQELDDLRAKLELNLATNSGVIEQYERRQREIDRLRKNLDDREGRKASLEGKIQRTKDRWIPALNELITSINAKFSDAFERVGCAGEIKLGTNDEGFEKWTIDILVKFRDTEKLQLLTGQRQSGGERALTTIMYLMSLTELARAPFSLVDEINQGMDQRYERAVHNSLVAVTCQEESGQYFLITPKLLTDLKYHERMKVLCVSNGEWLPEGQLSGSLVRMIDTYVNASQ